MKLKYILVLGLVLVGVLESGCVSSGTQVYYCGSDKNSTISFYADGTFITSDHDHPINDWSGTYTVHGTDIVIIVKPYDVPYMFHGYGTSHLTDQDGSIWTKV
jgi:hypothetical protein